MTNVSIVEPFVCAHAVHIVVAIQSRSMYGAHTRTYSTRDTAPIAPASSPITLIFVYLSIASIEARFKAVSDHIASSTLLDHPSDSPAGAPKRHSLCVTCMCWAEAVVISFKVQISQAWNRRAQMSTMSHGGSRAVNTHTTARLQRRAMWARRARALTSTNIKNRHNHGHRCTRCRQSPAGGPRCQQ